MQGDTRNDTRHECLERFDDFQKCVLVREQLLLQLTVRLIQQQASLSGAISHGRTQKPLSKRARRSLSRSP